MPPRRSRSPARQASAAPPAVGVPVAQPPPQHQVVALLAATQRQLVATVEHVGDRVLEAMYHNPDFRAALEENVAVQTQAAQHLSQRLLTDAPWRLVWFAALGVTAATTVLSLAATVVFRMVWYACAGVLLRHAFARGAAVEQLASVFVFVLAPALSLLDAPPPFVFGVLCGTLLSAAAAFAATR